ncbi:SHOCT domain-containing protein [Pseudoroseomonas wenyumeiae]
MELLLVVAQWSARKRRMHSRRKALATAFALLAVTGCSRHYTTAVDQTTGKQRIYAVTDSEADALAQGAILSSFPGRKVETISGPVRGYSTYTRMMLDTFTQQVIIKPVTGLRADGASVDGSVFEVSGSGTAVISGGIQNSNFADSLQRALDGTGKAVEVISTQPRGLTQTPPMQAVSGGTDVAQQLRTLKDLSDQGLISPGEYDQKRRELLNRL